ncbi:MAG: UDP-N-acetylmuramate:L-alanyl-gamma-D-glutamyl-meso-diaminopimelate ligase [Steroidobacteraceae bacterium]
MHLHILGICGTFMGGVAALAKAAGHRVTGSDRNVYPPMSTQLRALGIELMEGFGADQLSLRPDVIVVGNVMSRGMPVIEAMLDAGQRYTSGPQWLAEHVLAGRWVLAVAGTHGKTTTSSMLAHILEYAGLAPGFLIGGVPGNFDSSARLGGGTFFVIEADEYDTAFFDKRAKFVHYSPRTALLNNLEFDHADIYPDVAAIQRQFHHLLRIVPPSGRVIWNGADRNLAAVLGMGLWSQAETFMVGEDGDGLSARLCGEDYSVFEVVAGGAVQARVEWQLMGRHNVANALGAMVAARHAGVPLPVAARALAEFSGVKRRMQLRGSVRGVEVYDDFAHHPTAIATSIDGLRRRNRGERVLAVLEPRSNTMRMGVHGTALATALSGADEVWLYAPADIGWDVRAAMGTLASPLKVLDNIDVLAVQLATAARAGDRVLIMSNGGFGGLHEKLLARLGTAERPS